MSTKKTVEKFLLSNDFQRIKNSQNKFNLFSALNISRKELVHSDLIAYFLSPQQSHGCGGIIIQELFKCIYNHKENKNFLTFEEFISLSYQNTVAYREYSNIDILLDMRSSSAVFAIENKIDHLERKNQVKDYQEVVKNNFGTYKTKRIIFLTPDGSKSQTYNSQSNVRCISISYECISKALRNSISFCHNNDAKKFINECIKHIEEDLMKTGEEQQLINSIWENYDYAKVLKKIYEKRPTLLGIKDMYMNEIRNMVNELESSQVTFSIHPEKRKKTREIKFTIKKWVDYGYEFTFMFYESSNFSPATRVLLLGSSYSKNKEIYQNLANKNKELFDTNYSVIKGWTSWRKVFNEEDYPKRSYSDDLSYSERTVANAVSNMKRDIKKLSKYIA